MKSCKIRPHIREGSKTGAESLGRNFNAKCMLATRKKMRLWLILKYKEEIASFCFIVLKNEQGYHFCKIWYVKG